MIRALGAPGSRGSPPAGLVFWGLLALVMAGCTSGSSGTTAQSGSSEVRVLVSGLDNPRGVVVRSETEIFVVEAGTGYDAVDQTLNTGKLTQFSDRNGDGDFDDDGEADRWFSRLPTYNALSFFGTGRDEVSGPGDVLLHADGRIFLAVDGGIDEQDLFEISSQRRVGRSLAGRANMNGLAFDLDQSSIYAVESAANRLIEVPLDGEIRDIVTFAALAHDQQAVPAGLAVDPLTGEILVALFSGNAIDPGTGEVIPFVLGDSKIVRVDPTTGRVSDEITGLTVAVDVAIDASGNVYVVELASEPADTLPKLFDLFDLEGPVLHGGYRRFSGRITLHPADGGLPIVIVEELDLPTNITIGTDGSLYVSTGQGTPGRPIPGLDGPTRIVGQVIRITNFTGEPADPAAG